MLRLQDQFPSTVSTVYRCVIVWHMCVCVCARGPVGQGNEGVWGVEPIFLVLRPGWE